MGKKIEKENKVKTSKKSENKTNGKHVDKEEVISDPKILNDKEEISALENMQENYEKSLKIVQQNLNLDKNLVAKAIKCLQTVISDKYKDNLNLLANENDEFLFLNFVFSRLPVKFSLRPVNVGLPHSIYGQKFNTRVCLFVKDPRSDFKDLNLDFPFKVKVLDVEKLKLKYSRFQERRNLLKEYDIFLCDYKIYMLLKKLLGKPFYVQKKYPLPIKVDYTKPEEIKQEIVSRIEKSTIFNMSHGPNYTVKVSRVVNDKSETLENVMEAATKLIPHILKWGIDFNE